MEALTPDLARSVAIVNLIMAVLCSTLAYPLVVGMIPRNRMYGLRSRKSLASDQAWYRANRLGGTCVVVGASVIAALNGSYMVWGLPLPQAVSGHIIMYSTPVGLLGAAAVAWLLHLRD
jgi:hypothetical protein